MNHSWQLPSPAPHTGLPFINLDREPDVAARLAFQPTANVTDTSVLTDRGVGPLPGTTPGSVDNLATAKAAMANLKDNLNIYMAISDWQARSSTEDLLVLHGFDVSSFSAPDPLWERFLARPARFIILDRFFKNDASGLDFVKRIREQNLSPYVYILVRSTTERLGDVQEALAAGANDCVVVYKIHDPFQIQSRILVGLRWLNYLDSLRLKTATKTLGRQ